MSNPLDRYDQGIVFYGAKASSLPTYTDFLGVTRTAVLLVNGTAVKMAAEVESAFFHVGAASRYTFQVDVRTESEVTVDLGLEGHFDVDPTAQFGKLATFRNDDLQTKAVHTFSTTGRYILQTANVGTMAEAALAATLHGTPGDIVSIIVRLRVER